MKIALVSGGIDSTLMVKSFNFDKIIYIDTNSGYNTEEINSLKENNIDFEIIKQQYYVTKTGFSPLRNLLMISIVLNKYPADEIWLAGLKDDKIYDKNEGIFKDYSDILSKSLNRDVKVISPYFNITKGQLVEENKDKVDILLKTFSCYKPENGKECKMCSACFRKFVALQSNGIENEFFNKTLIVDYLKKLDEYDLDRQSRILRAIQKIMPITAIDIDGVLCKIDSNKYEYKIPIPEIILKINKIKGYKIIYTARFENDRNVTKEWLQKNNVIYHSLIMNKLPYNCLIDDLTYNPVIKTICKY